MVGPVFPVIPFFKRYGEVDWSVTSDYLQYLYDGGARNFYVMVHSSRLNLLDRFEITMLNNLPCEMFNDATVIGGLPPYGGLKASLNVMDNSKCDYMSIYFYERFYSIDYLIRFIVRHTDRGKKLLLHMEPFFSIDSTNRRNWDVWTFERVEQHINAVKEDSHDWELTKKLVKLDSRVEIITSGGSMEQFFYTGGSGWIVGIGSVIPQIELKFWEEYHSGDTEVCRKIIREFEEPFFKETKPIGWHLALKVALNEIDEKFSLWEREPLFELNAKSVRDITWRLEGKWK